jgi:rubrerythrin
MNEILKGCMIKVFNDDNEAREYLKPYNGYYWDMSQKIRDLKKYQQENIVKICDDCSTEKTLETYNKEDKPRPLCPICKGKQEVFDKIMEQLDEASDGYYEKLID